MLWFAAVVVALAAFGCSSSAVDSAAVTAALILATQYAAVGAATADSK